MKCLRVIHVKGSRDIVYNISNGVKKEYNSKTHVTTISRGHGVGISYQPDRLYLIVQSKNGSEFEIRVDDHFRQYWNKLSPSRIQKVKDNVPEEIEVLSDINRQGYKYFHIPESELDKWFLILTEKKKKEKEKA